MLFKPYKVTKEQDSELDIFIKGNKLDCTTKTDYLGVRIDSNLTWSEQINKMCTNLNIKLSKLRRLRKYVTLDIMRKIMESTIQPIFDYAITIWGFSAKTNITKIQRLQNQAARIVYNNYDYVNVRGLSLVKQLEWMTIEDRRDYFMNLLTFKCLNNTAPSYLSDLIHTNNDFHMHTRETRNSFANYLYVPIPQKHIYKTSFQYQSPLLYNKLSSEVISAPSVSSFKKQYKCNYKARVNTENM
jgi:hypothetical protein